MPQRIFIFIQLEFPWTLGPADGRYLQRVETNGDAERVIVIDTLAAGRGVDVVRTGGGGSVFSRLGSKTTSVSPSPEPVPVSTTRVTVIDPISLSAEQQARAWLEDFDRERDVLAALATVNRVLHAHRIAAADPYVHEVSPAQALVIRAGWGEGEQVASGRWLHARELPWPADGRKGTRRRNRTSALRPQERLAALLGARGTMLLCEELALRARLDLDQGRLVHAALELDAALTAAGRELPAEGRQDLAIRIAELDQLHGSVAEQARRALTDLDGREPDAEPFEPDEETLAHALGRLEAALRARTAAGIG